MIEEKQKILIVEDEKKIVEVIEAYLEKEGYSVYTAYTGLTGIELFYANKIDLVVLDLMLPKLSGEEVCKKIREVSDVPIIMLTAKIKNEDIIDGFSLGADDYIQKPFRTNELVVRIKAILKRCRDTNYNSNDMENVKIFVIDSVNDKKIYLSINYDNYTVLLNNNEVNLTPSEFKILVVLSRNPKRTFTREQLIEFALGDEFQGNDRTIDAYIKSLRQKIEIIPKEPKIITTVYGFGYRFDIDNN